MSVAGLRFNPDRQGTGAPLETKSGSYIYYGDPSSFHDWEFRTNLRIRLLEDQSLAKAQKDTPNPEQEEEDEFPFPMSFPGSPKAKEKPLGSPSKSSSSEVQLKADRSVLVNKVLEGLRGDAFEIARDIGLEDLTASDGLKLLITRIRQHVFPRAQEEAKELFRAGQKAHGPLARQPQESMLSFVSRRRRWWKILRELDNSMVYCQKSFEAS